MTERETERERERETSGAAAVRGAAREAPRIPPPGRRGRRTALIASAVVLVAAVAAVGTLELGGGGDEGPSAPPRSGSIVSVTRATLTERTAVDGQLGYGAELPLPVRAQGTVTWLPEPGAVVERGGELLRVDDRPVILLYGSLPMYRDLALTAQEDDEPEEGKEPEERGEASTSPKTSGSPTPGSAEGGSDADRAGTSSPEVPLEFRGADVRQFETNLAVLGYTGFTVDDRFTVATTAAVKRWQKSLGLRQTGAVAAGDVIYSTGRVRIGRAAGRPGSAVGEDTLTYTGTSRKVVVNASAGQAAWAVRGVEVTVTLPTGGAVKGTVASAGKQATAPEGGGGAGEGGSAGPEATIPVIITLQDQKAVGQLESGPVTVEYVGREVKNVLTVPVSALVALAEGGHGLETEEGRFVAVSTGLFADGKVEVSGPAVREGMKVRIPE